MKFKKILGITVLAVASTVALAACGAGGNKSAKDDKEFYEAYCHFMKRKYNFSPKVHLEDRLVKLGFSNDFIELNRELESAYYNNTPIDRKDIIIRIKKELRNEK